jgi:LytR cell envelope-related transcriptional attenuator
VTALVLALLAGGGYAAFLGLSGGSSNSGAATLPLCPLPTAPPVSQQTARPGPLRLTVENATERDGLAAEVAADLQTRGFHVLSIGNAVLLHKGVAVVRYSPDRLLVADRVAAQFKGATLLAVGGHGVVELDVGPKFKALATPAQARLAYLKLQTPVTPAPTSSESCRPRA